MINEELLLGKTIERIKYDESGDEDKIVLYFTDYTVAVITSNASKFMYSLFIEKTGSN